MPKAAGRITHKMMRFVLILSVLAFAMTLSGQGKGKGQGKSSGKPDKTGTTVSVSVVFDESDRRVIEQWVQVQPANSLPRGLAKRGELPPGLAKQLQRNGTLPPGLQKKISPFPSDLTRRLRPLPSDCGCDRIFLDGKAFIIARATSAILDVISLF
jgi:hypothetical protein